MLAGFTLRNFQLTLDKCFELDLPIVHYAVSMTQMLAAMHWAAGIDAGNVGFVLGSEYNVYDNLESGVRVRM